MLTFQVLLKRKSNCVPLTVLGWFVPVNLKIVCLYIKDTERQIICPKKSPFSLLLFHLDRNWKGRFITTCRKGLLKRHVWVAISKLGLLYTGHQFLCEEGQTSNRKTIKDDRFIVDFYHNDFSNHVLVVLLPLWMVLWHKIQLVSTCLSALCYLLAMEEGMVRVIFNLRASHMLINHMLCAWNEGGRGSQFLWRTFSNVNCFSCPQTVIHTFYAECETGLCFIEMYT